jgi:chemotaxis protein CheD
MEVQKTFYLLPGALFVSREPHMITTILGSCVAVCLYDKANLYGGINHFMLPNWSGQGLASPKYGDIAIKKLIAEMTQLGSRKEFLIAKLFGGASVLEATSETMMIGLKNIAVAKDTLHSLNIPLVSQNTGGNLGRKIIYNSADGTIYHKYLGGNKIGNK